jgi:uncharacterized lipoprotein YehR (DUF1307 family)
MKQLSFIVCIVCLTLTACQKTDEGVETIGTYNEQFSGIEGTITYAKDGKPAVGHPVVLQAGSANSSVSFDPLTGTFTPILDKNSYYKTLAV